MPNPGGTLRSGCSYPGAAGPAIAVSPGGHGVTCKPLQTRTGIHATASMYANVCCTHNVAYTRVVCPGVGSARQRGYTVGARATAAAWPKLASKSHVPTRLALPKVVVGGAFSGAAHANVSGLQQEGAHRPHRLSPSTPLPSRNPHTNATTYKVHAWPPIVVTRAVRFVRQGHMPYYTM